MCIRITGPEENYAFSIEPQGKMVRLVVYQSGVEKVCRLETRKNLEKLLLSDENHLFNGLLQSNKNDDGINVILKGKPVIKIGYEKFVKLLRNIDSVIRLNKIDAV